MFRTTKKFDAHTKMNAFSIIPFAQEQSTDTNPALAAIFWLFIPMLKQPSTSQVLLGPK